MLLALLGNLGLGGSPATETADAYHSLLSPIVARGIGVLSTITTTSGILSTVTDTHGISSMMNARGKGILSTITSDGKGIESAIKNTS